MVIFVLCNTMDFYNGFVHIFVLCNTKDFHNGFVHNNFVGVSRRYTDHHQGRGHP